MVDPGAEPETSAAAPARNYIHYFTEIEERFQQRRGTLLMLSTLDWALIDTWREAGVPLSAVLAGIDEAFLKHDVKTARGRGRHRRINGLAWCAQSVMEAAERQSEAAVGVDRASDAPSSSSGFEPERVHSFLLGNAHRLAAAVLPGTAVSMGQEIADRLRALGQEVMGERPPTLEALDLSLTTLEGRLIAALMTAIPEPELLAIREDAAREIAPLRGKLKAVQARQVQQQFLERRLLREHELPRLSLFYMSHE